MQAKQQGKGPSSIDLIFLQFKAL